MQAVQNETASELTGSEPRDTNGPPPRRDADLFLNDSEVFTFDFAAGEEGDEDENEPQAEHSEGDEEQTGPVAVRRDMSGSATPQSASRPGVPSHVARDGKQKKAKKAAHTVSAAQPLTAQEVRRYAAAARQAGPCRFLTLPQVKPGSAQAKDASKGSETAAPSSSSAAAWSSSFDEVAEVFTKNLRRYDEKLRLAQKVKRAAMRRPQHTKRPRSDK